jgi:putative nucleotidyltransferase with HDIG domain
MMLANSAEWNRMMSILRQCAPRNTPLFLVGGAVRDLLRGRPLHDLDLVLLGEVRSTARRVADALGGDFYMLDEERDTARVIEHGPDGELLFIDFCALRAADLEADLSARDFTVNAIAVDLRDPEKLIDPLHGADDLRAGLLRACSPQAFENDPVRVLRGVRQSLAFGIQLEAQTQEWMRAAAPQMGRISNERQRDEILRILEGNQAQTAFRMLEDLGVLAVVMPELTGMKGVVQSPPHTLDVWEHTLQVLAELDRVWNLLAADSPGGAVFSPQLAAAAQRLERFTPALKKHMAELLNPNRSIRALLFLAALYHDVSKPQTRMVEPGGRIRFFHHEEKGASLAGRRARELALSQDEVRRVEVIVRQHMRIHLLAQTGEPPSRRAVYRFFQDTGPAGVDIVLLSLADTLATYGETLSFKVWEAELEAARVLMHAWFEQPAQAVRPPRLIDGAELISELQLSPGPLVGRILAAIQEAQAAGEVSNRDQALELARGFLK